MSSAFRTRILVLMAVIAAAAAAAVLLASRGTSSTGKPLTIDVFAKQYGWTFGFPEHRDAFSLRRLHVPVDREVRFRFRTEDVGHAFWVPEWELKEDIVPGTVTRASVTPDRTGTFQAICSERCGIEHEGMRAPVVVEPVAQFERWVKGLKRKVPAHLKQLIRLDDELEAVRVEAESTP